MGGDIPSSMEARQEPINPSLLFLRKQRPCERKVSFLKIKIHSPYMNEGTVDGNGRYRLVVTREPNRVKP
jgi:hypothetical protein